MLVLHGLWSGESLCLWAEDDERTSGRGRSRITGRQPRARIAPPAPHPFAASPAALRRALAGLEEPGFASAVVGSVPLLLPTRAGRPLPSPSVWWARGSPGNAPSDRLLPWLVGVLRIGADEAASVLNRLIEGPPPDILIGEAIPALARGVDLGLELVASGRLLPGIVRDGDGMPEARWLPAPDRETADRLSSLAAALPPICRSEWRDGSVDGRDPNAIVAELVGAVVDRVARSALAGRRLVRAPGRRARGRKASAAFLAALTAANPARDLRGFNGDLAVLERDLAAWHRSGIPQAGPVRTCFRLHPPDEADGAWTVEFLLQSRDDPSLLLPAEDVWRAGRRPRLLGRTIDQPRERLLADLGHASRLYPDIERALDEARPTGLSTDTAGAYRFLAEAAPLLEQAGFGVIVPAWWRSSRRRLGLRARARTKSATGSVTSAGLGLKALAEYRYEIALGDDSLSEPELREMARLKVPLVRVRGEWMELRPDEVDAALHALEQTAAGSVATAGELLRAQLGIAPGPEGLPVVDVQADGWLGDLLSGSPQFEPVPMPVGFNGRLRPYQERGLGWLVFLDRLGLGAILADDMGLGKTIQLLALLLAEREAAGTGRGGQDRIAPTLLVCPMSLVGNWQREAERFAPGLRVHVHHGAERLAGEAFSSVADQADLVLTTYGLATRDDELLRSIAWGRIVVDEAQNIKNAETRQSRAIRGLGAPRRVALTGTPVENRLSELHAIMDYCNPGLLGPTRTFRTRFAIPIERYGDDEAAGRLRRVVAPFVLRRLKTDRSIIADLPDKIEIKVYCNLTREQATLYQAVVDDMLARIEASEGIERRGLVLATMMKLKQVCNHPAHLLADGSRLDGRSGKLARLEETIDEALAEDDRVLCFTQFAEMGHLLCDHLGRRLGEAVPFLHGGLTKRARDELVERFQADGGPRVLLLSLKAGGVGLNLTAASQVIHFDRWWNPAVEDQATDRAFRIGQRRNVQVRKLVCVGTLEERIDRMIEDKRSLAERIVGAGETWLTELSSAELRELVALSPDAVAEA